MKKLTLFFFYFWFTTPGIPGIESPKMEVKGPFPSEENCLTEKSNAVSLIVQGGTQPTFYVSQRCWRDEAQSCPTGCEFDQQTQKKGKKR